MLKTTDQYLKSIGVNLLTSNTYATRALSSAYYSILYSFYLAAFFLCGIPTIRPNCIAPIFILTFII